MARFKWKWHECRLESYNCSLHCGRQLHSRQKLHLTKVGNSKAWKAFDFKKWGSSLGALQKFTPMARESGQRCNSIVIPQLWQFVKSGGYGTPTPESGGMRIPYLLKWRLWAAHSSCTRMRCPVVRSIQKLLGKWKIRPPWNRRKFHFETWHTWLRWGDHRRSCFMAQTTCFGARTVILGVRMVRALKW